MQYLDLMLGSMVMNNISDFKTNILWIDLSIIFMVLASVYCMKDNKISTSIKDIIHEALFPSKNEKRITFMFKRGEQSARCKGLLHYLASNNNGSNIRHLIEDIFRKYDRYSDNEVEAGNLYRVDQLKSFNFTDKIKGKVFTEEKEAGEYNGKVTYKEFIHLLIYSETESLQVLQKFVEKCKQNYSKFLKEQMLDNQYLITIESNNTIKSTGTGDKEKKDLKISKEEWSSNVTFSSRFFPDKEDILETIDHFLDNSEWYRKKGLNHTLGILLSGDPGCGKTSFIKALMNYTKRHCIEVKLNDEFNFSDLKDIIYDEEIDDNIVIPQNKRIIVFEDIDAMGNIVKDRGLKEKENCDAEEKFKDEILKFISDDKKSKVTSKDSDEFVKIKQRINSKENNNLSYLLNILDGINETPGRIIIMTTNKPEVLDHALIRPGRIDLKINFTKSDETSIKQILYHYWKDEDEDSKDILYQINNSKINELDKKITPAEIIDICRKSTSINMSIKKMYNQFSKNKCYITDDDVSEESIVMEKYIDTIQVEGKKYFRNNNNILYDEFLKISGKWNEYEQQIETSNRYTVDI